MTNEDLLLASGYVRALELNLVINYQELDKEPSDHMVYTSNDIYKMLFDKGYCYRLDPKNHLHQCLHLILA